MSIHDKNESINAERNSDVNSEITKLQAKILKERAQTLAEEQQDIDTEENITVLGFQIANEKYGIETSYISNVLALKDLTPLPETPPALMGVINVHGDIIPVFDIKNIFDMPLLEQKQKTNSEKVVVISVADALFGIKVDDLIGVVDIAKDKIQDSLPTLTGLRSELLKGVTHDQMTILDPIKFSQDKTLVGDR